MQSISLFIAGGLTIMVALMHVGLPALWGWYREIGSLTKQSRRTIIDRNSFLILLLLIVAYLAFAVNEDMRTSYTGRALLLLLGIFWIMRSLWRAFGFPKSKMNVMMSVVYFLAGIFFLLALIP
ncbi:MAG TPA: hypothetical protein VMX35_07835 [Acidobacteriota bacterium]|nr:hypothetical protein [Acidobacteriota bacterium]